MWRTTTININRYMLCVSTCALYIISVHGRRGKIMRLWWVYIIMLYRDSTQSLIRGTCRRTRYIPAGGAFHFRRALRVRGNFYNIILLLYLRARSRRRLRGAAVATELIECARDQSTAPKFFTYLYAI